MHETAHYETGSGTAGQVQSRTLFHTQMAGQTTLSEEVGRKLNSTAETGSNHGGANTTVDSLNTLALVDLTQAIERVLIVVLSANGKERRKRLETGLHQEERRASGGTDNTRGGAGEDIGAERLNSGIVVDGGCNVGTDRFI